LEIRLPGSSSDGEPRETLGVLPDRIVTFGALPEAKLDLDPVREALFGDTPSNRDHCFQAGDHSLSPSGRECRWERSAGPN